MLLGRDCGNHRRLRRRFARPPAPRLGAWMRSGCEPFFLTIACMDVSRTIHVPVLLEEVLQGLGPRPGDVIVDGTLGGGGHAKALAERVGPGGHVIGIDRDPAALDRAEELLTGLPVRIAQANFRDLPEVLAQLHVDAVDGVLLDLGLSSDQLADARRGFSFSAEGELDLRFDPQEGEPAWRLVERLSAEHLADLLYHYGEERHSRRIAKAIVERRRQSPIRIASDLAELVRRCVPAQRGRSIDPATKTFQALRIAVNDELKSLGIALRRIPEHLRLGGRIAIISFHSLEDRPVKVAFRDDPRWRPLTKKPIVASAEEVDRNPRSRSAKLRIAQRTDAENPKPRK
jgi:16S rRNA (cytosine1402-N4)-methyltransferase